MPGDKDDIGASGKSIALEHRNTASDGRRYSPSVERNRAVIAEVFEAHMPLEGRILEIASGTGEHGAYLTKRFPELRWIYSDLDEASLASQRAWVAHSSAADRLSGPLKVDASAARWDEAELMASFDGMFCANMVHIAPWPAGVGLLSGAARLLRQGGRLFLYGPFARHGEIAPSNARFSEDLKRRDPDWGVRDLDRDLLPVADAAGLSLDSVTEMPANNLSVVFRKT